MSITISIVSHHHGTMVQALVEQLLRLPSIVQVIVTLNLPEALAWPADSRLQVLSNPAPKGFAANHNAAFAYCQGVYFCPLNPDIALSGDPFPALLGLLADPRVGLAAPRVVSPGGENEDSWRRFPTLLSLTRKALGLGDGRYVVAEGEASLSPQWVAGMFMLFRSEVFRTLGGFDEGYFLYYEDVDICLRLWRKGHRILAAPGAVVVHAARRDSHRRLRYLRWHLTSLLRYLLRDSWRLPRRVEQTP